MSISEETLQTTCKQVISGEQLSLEQALQLISVPDHLFFDLLHGARQVKAHSFGLKANLCCIINAKSGLCPENCAFCAQSAHHTTNAAVYPLVEKDMIVARARQAAADGAACFGIVTSGTGISDGDELDHICDAVRQIRDEGLIAPGASLGTLTLESAARLKQAGLVTYHHNLETSRSFFPNICTSHDYEDDVETVRLAKQAGFRVCCGGLFGLGESMEQRVELAMTLRELQVDSVPINFLDPVEGTPICGISQLTPRECLHTIALFRLILPQAHITVCGGRQRNLKDLQSWILLAGASGLMTGNYLTKEGRNPDQDRAMLVDQGALLTKELLG